MPTDAELRDAAVAHLLHTTTGYRKTNGQPKSPPWPEGSSHWAPALALLEQIGQLGPAPIPFAEAALRSGWELVTLPDGASAGTSSSPVNGGEDCLIDLQGIWRTRAVYVWTKAGQRVRVVNGRFKDTKNGLIMRSVDGIGAEHISATDMRGRNLIDDFVVSGNPGSQTVYTLQKFRTDVPSSNVNDGGEHADCVQVQGDLKRLEIGLSTFCQLGVGGGSGHPGKGLMLNTISKLPFEVDLRYVNYRAAPGLETGAAIFKDYAAISMRTHEVYYDGPFWGTSRCLFPTATFSGDEASWPASVNWQGVVKRGLPPGGDFCP